MDEQNEPEIKIGKIWPTVIFLAVALFVIGGSVFVWQKEALEREREARRQSVVPSYQDKILPKEEEPKEQKPFVQQERFFLYQKGLSVFLYDTQTKEKKEILISDVLVDFDLSPDGNFLTYTLKETGIFAGNSDIYAADLKTQKVKRLTKRDNIAAYRPTIMSGDKMVVFLRKEYSTSTKALLAEEIWEMEVNGEFGSERMVSEEHDKPSSFADTDGRLSDNLLIRTKKMDNGKYGIFIYDLANNIEEKIDDSSRPIRFAL